MALSKIFSKLSSTFGGSRRQKQKSTLSLSGEADMRIKAKLLLKVPVFSHQTADKAIQAANSLYITNKPRVVLTITKDSICLTRSDKSNPEVLVDIPHSRPCEAVVTETNFLVIKYQNHMGPLSIAVLKIRKKRFFRRSPPKINSVDIVHLIDQLRSEYREEQQLEEQLFELCQPLRECSNYSSSVYPGEVDGSETNSIGECSLSNDRITFEDFLRKPFCTCSIDDLNRSVSENSFDQYSTNSQVNSCTSDTLTVSEPCSFNSVESNVGSHNSDGGISKCSLNRYSTMSNTDSSLYPFSSEDDYNTDTDSVSIQSFESSSTYVIASGCINKNVSRLAESLSGDSSFNGSLDCDWESDNFDDILFSDGGKSYVSELESSESNYSLGEVIESILQD